MSICSQPQSNESALRFGYAEAGVKNGKDPEWFVANGLCQNEVFYTASFLKNGEGVFLGPLTVGNGISVNGTITAAEEVNAAGLNVIGHAQTGTHSTGDLSAQNIIASNITTSGSIYSKGDITTEGQVEGDVGCFRNQPFFIAYLFNNQGSVTGLTGGGTFATFKPDVVHKNTGFQYDSATGVLKALKAGNYEINCRVTLQNLKNDNVEGYLYLDLLNGLDHITSLGNLSAMKSINNHYTAQSTWNVDIEKDETFTVSVMTTGSQVFPSGVGILGTDPSIQGPSGGVQSTCSAKLLS